MQTISIVYPSLAILHIYQFSSQLSRAHYPPGTGLGTMYTAVNKTESLSSCGLQSTCEMDAKETQINIQLQTVISAIREKNRRPCKTATLRL